MNRRLLILSLITGLCFQQKLNAQVKATPAQERMKIFSQQEALLKKSVVNQISFRSIGPSITTGRVVELAVNESNPIEFYAAYANGGLWYTNNNGQSFIPVFDSVGVLSIGTITVNWETGTIWVGTGEGETAYEDRPGMGIYKSTDRGLTWKNMGLPESQHINKIVVDPRNDNIVWVAVMGHFKSPNKERGVYVTKDGGQTWKQSLYINEATSATDLAINPQKPNEVYAAMWHNIRHGISPLENTGKTSGIYKTINGGKSWQLISTMNSGFPTGDAIGRIGLALYPPNPNIVYASVINKTIVRRDTLKYEQAPMQAYDWVDFKDLTGKQFSELDDNKLDSFLKVNRLPYQARKLKEMVSDSELKPAAIYEYFIDHNYFEIRVEDEYANSNGIELYRSDNGGTSWKKMNKADLPGSWAYGKIVLSGTNDSTIIVLGDKFAKISTDAGKTYKAIAGKNVHADHHAAWIDPKYNGHIILGGDGGLNMTYDFAKNWIKISPPGLSVGLFYSIAVDNQKPYNVYGGLQDNGSWFGPSTNVEDYSWYRYGHPLFQRIFEDDADGTVVKIDTSAGHFAVYASTTGRTFGNFEKYTVCNSYASPLSLQLAKRDINPRDRLGEKPFRKNWKTPIMLSKHNPEIVYYGANKLFHSLDEDDEWKAISPDLTRGGIKGVEMGTITATDESPFQFGLLYVGTDDGNVQISKNCGGSWQLISPSFSPDIFLKNTSKENQKGLDVVSIVASAYKKSRVYITMNGFRYDHFAPYLFVSEDYGATWTKLGMDLPCEPVNVIREDPQNENILYAGTDGGLYVSFDRGKTFMMWNAGLPRSVTINDIAIQQRDNEIVLGTWGRGLYVAKLDDVQGLAGDPKWISKKGDTAKDEPAKENKDEDEGTGIGSDH